MLRSSSSSSSKSRSGYLDFGQKTKSSVISRSISAAKICRGDVIVSQVDKGALVSVEKNHTKFLNLSHQRRKVKGSTMQQQMGDLEEELKHTKEQLGATEGERDRAMDELRETKWVADEATTRLCDSLSPGKAEELFAELKKVKDLLSNSKRELKMKEKDIMSLKIELENAKQSEIKMAESEASERDKQIQELEVEVEKGKAAESKMFESVVAQTKQLEQVKIELEESKLEVSSLRQKMEECQSSPTKSNGEPNENFESIKSELEMVKEKLSRAEEGEKVALTKAKTLLDEMELLINELKLATEAEEKSKKAMDDLALALKEVATEANQAKEKLGLTEAELEHVKGEAEQLKEMVRSNEDKYKKNLEEINKELELHKNTVDRLRVEAEESVLAWNGKEMGFVTCIKRTEEEKAVVLHENVRLAESLKAAENMTRTAREESYKLRDILKQALNEANVAKEAANIAVAENSELKDNLAEKEETLHFLTRENERLRINEAAAVENIKELKRLLSAAKTNGLDSKVEDKEQGESSMFNSPESSFHEDHPDQAMKIFSFDLNELKLYDAHEDVDKLADVDEDPEKAEALKGSIFDPTVTASPKSEPRTPIKQPLHHRTHSSSTFTDDGNISEDFDHQSGHESHDEDGNAHRKQKGLLRRFGDLITRKSFHRRDHSTGTGSATATVSATATATATSTGSGWWSPPICAHID